MAKAVNIARSHRLDGIGEYYFSRRLREIAEIEAATGRQIVKLAMGSPDLPPHQSVIDRLAKEAQRPDVHKYMSYQGEPILRKAFADWYKKWYHVDLDFKSEVYPLIGSKEGIMHICMTFLNPGDKVLVPNPGYPTYSAAVRLSGGEMLPYALNKQTNSPRDTAGDDYGSLGSNIVYINIWNYDPSWTIEVTENGTPLPWTRVFDRDPLHTLCYDIPRVQNGGELTTDNASNRNSHMFAVQASGPATTLTVKVTDRFGETYTETMTRPKAFTTQMK